jgi:hypothetical protein
MVPAIVGLTKSDESDATAAPFNYWLNLDEYDSADQCKARAAELEDTGAQEREESDAELLKNGVYSELPMWPEPGP